MAEMQRECDEAGIREAELDQDCNRQGRAALGVGSRGRREFICPQCCHILLDAALTVLMGPRHRFWANKLGEEEAEREDGKAASRS